MTQRYFEDVEIGETIPDLVVSVDPVQMFYFSAATYNGHRIHYDRTWTTEVEGYPDIVVQGPLQAALLARAVTDWMGGGGWLVRFAVQNRGSAFGEAHFSATVTANGEGAGAWSTWRSGRQGRWPGADAGHRHSPPPRRVTLREAER